MSKPIYGNTVGVSKESQLEPRIAHNSNRINSIEGKLNIDNDIVKIVSGYSEVFESGATTEYQKSYKYIRILKLGSNGKTEEYVIEGSTSISYMHVRQYIDHIDDYENTVFSFSSGVLSKCPDFGVGNSDSERYANYIFFDGGKAYYHQGCRLYETIGSEYPGLADGEIMLEEKISPYDSSFIIVGLAEPIITDISDVYDFDGVIEVTTRSDYGDVTEDYGNTELNFYGVGYYEFAYMTKEGA